MTSVHSMEEDSVVPEDYSWDTDVLVRQAMKLWGQSTPEEPCLMDEQTKALRIKLLEEELQELREAFAKGDLENILKELCDLQYVLDGTFIASGMHYVKIPAFYAVHMSNMSKLVDGKPLKNTDGKVIKGPNYKPADLKEFVE